MRKLPRMKHLRLHSVEAIAVLAVVVTLVLVAISPLALREVSGLHDLNWIRLSDIAQTYGAVSVLLNAIALGGVVFSLIYQARVLKISAIQAQRSFHHGLLQLEMADPLYMEASGAPWGLPLEFDYDRLRQRTFVHMWITFWEDRYVLGELREDELRENASEMFCGAPAREYWSTVRDLRSRFYTSGPKKRFTIIMDAEHAKALAASPPRTMNGSGERIYGSRQTTKSGTWATKGMALGAGCIGLVIGMLAASRRCHPACGQHRYQHGDRL